MELENIIAKGEFAVYGIRADYKQYNIGDSMENSHEWYQDPWEEYNPETDQMEYITTEDERFNPLNGCWDFGELNGICTIAVSHDNIAKVIDHVKKTYHGEHLYLVGGDDGYSGNDIGELIIENPVCLAEI